METQNNVIDPVTVPEQPEPTPQPEQQEPEIALENGELKLSDSFFEQPDENAQNVQEQQVHELKSLEQQNYYTDDELNNTLISCGFAQLYVRHPFDCLLLYCANSYDPILTLHLLNERN